MNQQQFDSVLLTTRIIWASMLMGMLLFGAIVMMQLNPDEAGQENTQFLGFMSLGLMVIAIPIGYFLRMTTYKKGWEGNRINPPEYSTGNIFLFASIEMPAMLALVHTLIENQWGIHSIPAGLGILLFLINFPTGKAMLENPSENEKPKDDFAKDDDEHVVHER